MNKLTRFCGVCSLAVVLSEYTTAQSVPIPELPAGPPKLLTQPYLQNPTETGVTVVWLTNFVGSHHHLILGADRLHKRGGLSGGGFHSSGNSSWDRGRPRFVRARTVKLHRLFEDASSKLEDTTAQVSRRVVYRHEAVVDGLVADVARTYWIASVTDDGQTLDAGPYTLQPLPSEGRPLEILLTSDQQERFNTLANYQKVAELFPALDAIFFAGDLANHPRRGSEWFDNFRESWRSNPLSASPSFFPAMQGTFRNFVPESPYRGGELLQNIPLFPSVASHEVSGRFRPNETYVLTRAHGSRAAHSVCRRERVGARQACVDAAERPIAPAGI